jgi:hypothetical protein
LRKRAQLGKSHAAMVQIPAILNHVDALIILQRNFAHKSARSVSTSKKSFVEKGS